MTRITLIGSWNFTPEQMDRLNSLGKITNVDVPSSGQEWKKISQETDVICSDGNNLLENLYELENVYVTYPFIELGNFDSNRLEENGVIISNTAGSNRDSIVEWTIFMILSLLRNFISKVRVENNIDFEATESLVGKNLLIIGKGTIGEQIGIVGKTLGMNVDYFTRNDNLKEKSSNADVIVNALNCNPTSMNLLNEEFFLSLKKGSYFISFGRLFTYDLDGMIKALDNEILAGAGIDCDPEGSGDTQNEFYQKCLSNDKILVTPHIAFSTKQALSNGKEFVVQNIEAFAKGEPTNILKK